MRLKLLQVREASGVYFSGSEHVVQEMREEAKADRECFWVLHLSTRNQVIEKELVAIGSVDQATVAPREVFKKAIINGAKSIITVHNHPSGDVSPSNADIELWKRLSKIGKLLLMECLDHLIIGPRGEYYSARKEGIIFSDDD